MKTAPSFISELSAHQVFVFGSNLAGIHGAGAALQAYKQFGAEWGTGEGMTGSCYAIPTKDRQIRTLGLVAIQQAVDRFLNIAEMSHWMEFLVTPIGCGLAGYKEKDIAPLFLRHSNNVLLPESFVEVLSCGTTGTLKPKG